MGDVPYHPLSLFAVLTETNPSAMLLYRSFMITLLDKSEKVLPSITPDNFIAQFALNEVIAPMIQITDLNKKFGKLEVLKNVNLNCNKGECIALIGPNGCGKTTLIKSILGMVLPDKGEITFNEKPIKNEYLYREKIGYMPRIGRYPDNMTIGHVIEMIKQIRNTNQELDEDLLKAFELEKMFDKQMRTLSGGKPPKK